MKTLISLLIIVGCNQALAFEKENSFGSLQAALSESNKDYNEHKKEVLNEDNERITDWNDRETVQVTIEASIQEEARDYMINEDELAERAAAQQDLLEFEEKTNELPVLQEVSMND